MNERQKGFTLIELMIVVAIIAIIAAIAIPSLMNARKSGNQASAVASLKAIISVNQMYRTRFQTYAPRLVHLIDAGYIDEGFSDAIKSGYEFFYNGTGEAWVCLVNPRVAGRTGDLYYFSDAQGVIRFSPTPVAGAGSPPID